MRRIGVVLLGAALLSGAAAAAPLDVVARVAVGAEPLGLAIAGAGDILVVAAQGRTLQRIATDDPPHVVATLDLAAHGRLNRAAVAPDGTIYVTASVEARVLVIDPAATRVTAVIDGLAFPQGMVVTAERLLVANSADQTIAVIDRAALTIERSVRSGERPSQLVLDRRNGEVLALNMTGRSIRRLALVPPHETTAILSWPQLTRPQDLVITDAGDTLVVDAVFDGLLVLRAGETAPSASIGLIGPDCDACEVFAPTALALSADGMTVAAAGRGGIVSLIDLATMRTTASARVGVDLRDIVFGPDGRLYTSSFGSNEVIVLDAD